MASRGHVDPRGECQLSSESERQLPSEPPGYAGLRADAESPVSAGAKRARQCRVALRLPSARPPPSPAAEDATPQSLASYERPLATLEFALEKPAAQPLLTPIRSSLASIDSSAQSQSRPPTPLPRVSLLSSPFSTPFPRPAQLPRLGALATPMPSSPRPSPPPPPVEMAPAVAPRRREPLADPAGACHTQQ